jgi:hypothetical protein
MRRGGSYRGKTGHASLWWLRRFLTQTGVSPPKIAALRKAHFAAREFRNMDMNSSEKIDISGTCQPAFLAQSLHQPEGLTTPSTT